MAPLIIYGMELSPPVRSVFMVARSLELEYEFKEVNLMKDEHLTTEYLKMNPQHTIPTLDDNGFILWDSAAIASYLASKYGKSDSLYPKDLQKRAIVDQRLHFNSGILFPRLRNICFPCLFLGEKAIAEENKAKMLEAYEFLERFLANSNWLAGDQLTIADICAVSNISSLFSVITIDPVKFPKLTAWLDRCRETPCYQVNKVGAEELGATINRLIGRGL